MKYALTEKAFPIQDDDGIDEVLDKIASLTAAKHPVEAITITKKAIKVSIWEQDDEPPFGELPQESPTTIAALLQNVRLHAGSDDVQIRLESLSILAGALMEARRMGLAGVGWVCGDAEVFTEWLGLRKVPNRFLEIPVMQYEEMPKTKVVLLCGTSSRNHFLTATDAIVMEIQCQNVAVERS